MENWSRTCKRSYKLNSNGVGIIRNCSFLVTLFTTLLLMILQKLDCQSWKKKQKNQALWLVYSSASASELRQSSFNYKIVSDRVISRISVLLSNCWFDFRKIVLFYASELVKPALKCLKTFETNVSRKNFFLKMTHTLYYFSICFYSKRSPRDNNGRVINK